jgi:glycosyl hydrolase family 28
MKRSLLLIASHLIISVIAFGQSKTFNIVAFGAKGDGRTLNTVFIQKAIDKAAAAGGGKVIIPAGRFVTGVIHLKTGVNLWLHNDAVLLGSTNRFDYGKETVEALITAKDQQRIAITGTGEIDGRGRELVKNMYKLFRQGVIQDEQWKIKRPTEKSRPDIIVFTGCTDITVKGITIKNSACWVQDYRGCKNVVIDSITVNSTEYWNNDGIDISNSHNVSITRCFIDAADDAICLKSEGEPGTCENVSVSDCILRSSASAFKLGTGSRGGFRNIVVKNLTVYDTYRSAIALEAVDGGFLENVNIQQVKAINTGNAIFIRLGHRNNDSLYSTIKNIVIADVQVQVPAGKPDVGYPVEGPLKKFSHNVFPASIVGLPGHTIENVELKNIVISYEGGGTKEKAFFGWDSLSRVPENAPDYPEFSMFGELPSWGLYVRHVNGLHLQNVQLSLQQPDYRPACLFDDVQNLKLSAVNIPFCNTQPVIILNNVKEHTFDQLKLPVEESKAIKMQ